MGRLDDLKAELAATVQYGKQINEKLKGDLGEAERLELNAEGDVILKKAEELQGEIVKEQKAVDRDLKIKAIGRDMQVPATPDEPEQVRYKDAFEAFVKSDSFGRFRADLAKGRRGMSDPVEFKVAADVTSDPAGDKATPQIGGFANLNYTFDLEVGNLFSQGTMSGSNIGFLKIPTGATGDADYQATLGGQKGGTFAMDVDASIVYAQTIAAVATIPAQNLDDLDGLESEIRTVLTVGPNGLGEMSEDEYLNGDGSGALEGVLHLNPDDSTLAGDYLSKSVFKAAADIKADSGFTADAVVCHPDDWFLLSTEVGSSDDRPLFGPWGTGWGQNGVGPRLVVSRKIASGTILVGAFKASTRYVRQGLTITADASGLGLRDKNLVLFVAEKREALMHRFGKDPYRTVTVES